MPTLEEWNKVREITVKGSSALSCETKMVREWLRVSCRGKNDSGGTPTTVKVTTGYRPGQVYAFTNGAVTSLVMAYIEGVQLTAVFSWTDKSHPLKVSWPKGAKQPTILGVFEGAASPLDGAAASSDAAIQVRLCECYKSEEPDVYMTLDCKGTEELPMLASADCARTYQACQAFIECSRGEPERLPKCLPGFVNLMYGGMCGKDCSQGEACPSGTRCAPVDGKDGVKACQ